MRKNKMMRAASALLVAVLLTTSTISGTFAKYVTQDSASDTARVAKWGVELQVEGNLFGENYVNAIAPDGATAAELAVESNYNLLAEAPNPDDVVAPGTENDEVFTFSINGKPEVSGQIVVEKLEIQNIFLKAGTYGVMVEVPVNTVTKENFDEFAPNTFYYLDSDGVTYRVATTYDKAQFTLEDAYTLVQDYYPVIFKLDGATAFSAGTCYEDSLEKVANTIAAKFTAYGSSIVGDTRVYTFPETSVIKFNPNTTLADLGFGLERIKWEWAFDTQDDFADTILGNLMADLKVVKDQGDGSYKAPVAAADNKLNDYCLKLKFDLAIRVEQIDDAANVVTP